ncbi:MAG: N-acetylneuraminic acid mutarotase [Chitinophagales bacterium]
MDYTFFQYQAPNTMNRILLVALVCLTSTLFAQTWEQQGDALVGRHHPISFSLDGKGYAITGTLISGQPTDDAYEYDPVTDTWTSIADFPGTARSFGIGTVTNNIAYLGLGATNNQYLNDFWSFEPSTGTWTQLANCGCSGRRHPAMIATATKVYVGLGDDATGNLKDWWMYDIAANSWTQLADLPGVIRHHPFMFNAGGEVFAGMGHGNSIYKDWYKLDTLANTWTAMNDFPGEARVAGTQFSYNGLGYVISGDGDNHDFMQTGEFWEYTPATDSWEELPPHPGISRWAPGSFTIDNDVYFFGGQNRQTNAFPSDVWKYSLPAAPGPPVISGIADQVLANTFVYPNPSNGVIFWKNDESVNEVKVYNTLGKLVLSSAAEGKQLDAQELNSGIYIVQFYSNASVVKTSKLLIQQ